MNSGVDLMESEAGLKALYKIYPRRRSDIYDTMQEFTCNIQKIIDEGGLNPLQERNFWEIQRIALGKAYRLSGDILNLTKKAIHALKHKPYKVAALCQEILWRYKEMLRLKLPGDIAWQFQAEVGQEIVEVDFVKNLFWTLFFARDPQLPSMPEELEVTPQAYLAGIGDVAGELGKIMEEFFLDCEVSEFDRVVYELRFRDVYCALYDFLEQFETVYGRVINNSRRPGYGNTYRGMLRGVQVMVSRHRDRVIRALADMGEVVEEHQNGVPAPEPD